MDVSVTESPSNAPGAADLGFAAGVATVLTGEAVEAATEAQEAAEQAALDAQRAAADAAAVESQSFSAQMTAEAAHERIDMVWESLNEFREDMITVMNAAAEDVGELDQQLPPLQQQVDQ